MKRLIILTICILFLFCGCASQSAKNSDDYFVQSQDCALYDDIIEDYRNIVSFRFLEDFEYFWNYGEFIEVSDTLLQALTVSGSDLDYRWSNMIVEMPSADSTKSSFGYILTDINYDSCPELFWVRNDHFVLAVFTVYDGRVFLLDAFWSRYMCVINDDGMLYTQGSGGASISDYEIRKLSDDAKLVKTYGFSMYNEEYTEYSDGETFYIDKTEFDKLLINYPFENSQRWIKTKITPLF